MLLNKTRVGNADSGGLHLPKIVIRRRVYTYKHSSIFVGTKCFFSQRLSCRQGRQEDARPIVEFVTNVIWAEMHYNFEFVSQLELSYALACQQLI